MGKYPKFYTFTLEFASHKSINKFSPYPDPRFKNAMARRDRLYLYGARF
jgi:hypothetical protein